MMPMLEVSDVSKTFGGLKAVAEASLQVPEGGIVSLIGPNGAGKTTLFAIVSGFIRPDSGRIVFQGTEVTGMAPHRICHLGLVRTFQVVQSFARLTVLQNIAIGAHVRHRGRSQALDRAAEVARRVGLQGQLDEPAADLTVAGRKRLELARALATEPKLLLLDEVMSGLTPTETDGIIQVVRGIRDSGITVFLIEHVMQAVMRLSEYTYVLNNGAIIAAGSPEEIAADANVVEAYLGHGAAQRMAAAGARPGGGDG